MTCGIPAEITHLCNKTLVPHCPLFIDTSEVKSEKKDQKCGLDFINSTRIDGLLSSEKYFCEKEVVFFTLVKNSLSLQ